ncbi:MAG TPA: DUF1289 domain-containing protein [Herbaspirillum sp.]
MEQPKARPDLRPDSRPDTPCVAVCSTLFDDICRGCGRTADEVSQWVVMTEQQKDQVWERILAQGYPRRQS